MRFLPSLVRIGEIIANPTSNLTVAVLMLAIVILVVLMAVLVLLMLVQSPHGGSSPKRPAPRTKAAARSRAAQARMDETERAHDADAAPSGEPHPASGPVVDFLLGPFAPWLIAALVVTAAVYALASTSSDTYCAQTCHAATSAVKRRSEDVHRKVPCTACHENPGAGSVVDSAARRLVHSGANVVDVGAYARPVSSAACLSCHGGDISEPTTNVARGTRMSHAEPLAAGMSCSDCHPNMGHAEATQTAGMSQCVRCHDDHTADADCDACHIGDTSRAIKSSAFSGRLYPRTRVMRTDCGGCHSQKSCDKCHGLRLPHPQRFLQWEHARYAGFGRKELCYRCHTESDCTGRCHGEFSSHGDAWFQRHKASGRADGCSCHRRKLPPEGQARGSFCAVCH